MPLDVQAQMRGRVTLRDLAGHVGSMGLRGVLAVMRHRRTRWQLATLDPQRLDDIGVSRADALRQVRRSFPFYGRSVPDRLGDWS